MIRSTKRMEPDEIILTLVDEQDVERPFHCEQTCTVLEAALKNKIELNHSCGGMGTCGTCRVRILSSLESLGPLEPRNEIEIEMANDRGFAENERLACQLAIVNGLKFRIP